MYEDIWRSRGYLPHFDPSGAIQVVTSRLADSLPADYLHRLKQEIPRAQSSTRRQAIETLLDQGLGFCVLGNAECASIVQDEVLALDGICAEVFAWVVMPNHFHMMLRVAGGWTLARTMFQLKGRTSRLINKYLGRRGSLWQKEYFDRVIRGEDHFRSAVEYIHNNPVKAKLVTNASDWVFSSVNNPVCISQQQVVLAG